MKSRVALLTSLTALATVSVAPSSAAEVELLPVEEAFKVSARLQDDLLHVDWVVADGYYLVKERLHIQTSASALGTPQFPRGERRDDPFFGEVEVFRHDVTARVPVGTGHNPVDNWTVWVTSQGCADIGVCYPPHTQSLLVPRPVAATAGLLKVNSQSSQSAIEALRDLNRSVVGPSAEEFLPPEMAYILSVRVDGPETVVVSWDIAEGYYLYREKLGATVIEPIGNEVVGVDMPLGEPKMDEYFGEVDVFYDGVEYRLDIERSSSEATEVLIEIAYQGCADAGLCYPPLKHEVALELPALDGAGAVQTSPSQTSIEKQSVTGTLRSGHAERADAS